MGGGHALVQLVKDSGQYHFKTSHRELSVEVYGVEAIFSESLYDIPNVYQMPWKQGKHDMSILLGDNGE